MSEYTPGRHGELLRLIAGYLEDSGKSARWFGWQVARDFRLVPNLKRGQVYPYEVLLRAAERILAHYEGQTLIDMLGRQVIRPERRCAAVA